MRSGFVRASRLYNVESGTPIRPIKRPIRTFSRRSRSGKLKLTEGSRQANLFGTTTGSTGYLLKNGLAATPVSHNRVPGEVRRVSSISSRACKGSSFSRYVVTSSRIGVGTRSRSRYSMTTASACPSMVLLGGVILILRLRQEMRGRRNYWPSPMVRMQIPPITAMNPQLLNGKAVVRDEPPHRIRRV